MMEIPVRVAGVYFLVSRGRIVYVGKTKGPVTVARHLAHAGAKSYAGSVFKYPTKKFDKAFFWPCSVRSLDDLEGALIVHLRPKYNTQVPKLKIPPAKVTRLVERFLRSLT